MPVAAVSSFLYTMWYVDWLTHISVKAGAIHCRIVRGAGEGIISWSGKREIASACISEGAPCPCEGSGQADVLWGALDGDYTLDGHWKWVRTIVYLIGCIAIGLGWSCTTDSICQCEGAGLWQARACLRRFAPSSWARIIAPTDKREVSRDAQALLVWSGDLCVCDHK